jgi:hypothetical protein
MARIRFGGDGVHDGEPSAQSHGEEMMAPGVRPHKRKAKRVGGRFGRKHGRKSSKRE